MTSAHLISYHPDRDILPMVMANCHYTFQVGKGTKIDYNLGDLERQLMDRFLFSKSVINMPVYEVSLKTNWALGVRPILYLLVCDRSVLANKEYQGMGRGHSVSYLCIRPDIT